MKAIVAVDSKWGIGKNNGLLFSLPADMAFFRTTTLNKIVVMGSNTLKSFPNAKPLKNRVNLVFSKSLGQREDCVVLNSFEKLCEELKKYPTDDIYIIGGAMFYKLMLPYCESVLVTKVDADGDADTFFENLDALESWQCVSEGETVQTNGFDIRFTEYKNLDIKKL